jgi:hypothetical protein
MNQKSLDKKKGKELDWVDRLKDALDGEWFCAGLSYLRRPNSNIYDLFELHIIDEVKNIISSLLIQQRTELLEEILEHNKDEMTGLYDFDGIALEVISLVKK